MQYILRYYEYIYECRTTCITVLPKHLSLESNSLVELSDTMSESSLYTTPIMASMQAKFDHIIYILFLEGSSLLLCRCFDSSIGSTVFDEVVQRSPHHKPKRNVEQ